MYGRMTINSVPLYSLSFTVYVNLTRMLKLHIQKYKVVINIQHAITCSSGAKQHSDKAINHSKGGVAGSQSTGRQCSIVRWTGAEEMPCSVHRGDA